ncbi:MAG TPA: transporter [Flavobacterium sp.]|jgi:hypothetical protein
MKKSILMIVAGLSLTAMHAQEITTADAIRYAQDNLTGTARFRAMSGAFGALGGDLSSINVNPAGSAIFANNQFGASLTSYNTKNESDYFGTNTSATNSAFDLNQIGAVFVFDNDNTNSGWRKLTLAVNYENANNFDDSRYSAGTNPSNSIANYFVNYANMGGGIALSTLENNNYEQLGFADQQAFLGYHSYLINPTTTDPANNTYISNVPAGNYFQENYFESTGYNGKVTFNAAAQYKDKLYIGLNLNSHFTDYRQVSSLYESNDNNLTTGIQRVRFNNELYTYGSGFSFQLGTIAKVTKEFRIGLAYESPTWLQLFDELSQSISSVRSEEGNEQPVTGVNPQVVNVYEGYNLQTPSKWTGSLAYVFGKKGLVSLDYALKDYSSTKFKPTNDTQLQTLNTEMSNFLDTTGELRIGAEYRIKEFSLRGGFRNEQSPYKNKSIMGDLTGYSAGIGYNFGATKLDLAYSYAQREFEQGFLTSGLTNAANFDAINNNVTLTLLFEL